MGKSKSQKQKKRKLDSDLPGECSESSEPNTSYTSRAMSSILGAVNGVLYGSPGREDIGAPTTSTPDPNVPEQNSSIHLKFDWIMSKLEKLDLLEENMKRIDDTVSRMDHRVAIVEQRTVEVEKYVDYVSKATDDLDKKCKDIGQLISAFKTQERKVDELRNDIEGMNRHKDELVDTVLDLRCRSMKDTLIFRGLFGENGMEDTEAKLRDFLHFELGLDSNLIGFANVHRFGKFIQGRPRPIVARFIHHRDMLTVQENAYKLRGSRFSINEQFPEVIEDRRRQLYPVMKRLRMNGNSRVKLVRDKLYVNGKLYDELSAPVSTTHSDGPRILQRDRLQRSQLSTSHAGDSRASQENGMDTQSSTPRVSSPQPSYRDRVTGQATVGQPRR